MIKKQLINLLEKCCPYYTLKLRANIHLSTGETELRYLKDLVDSEKVAIDVGANKGIYSYWFSRFAQETITFEPHPICAEYLQQALGDRIQLIVAALSDSEGSVSLTVPATNGEERSYRGSIQKETTENFDKTVEYSVEKTTLDKFNFKAVGFLKIDVEGHELAVLKGARNLLTRDHPSILVEAEERHRTNSVSSIIEYLTPLQYDGYFLLNNEWVSISNFNSNEHQDTSNESNAYINNFLFLSQHINHKDTLKLKKQSKPTHS